MIKAIFYPLVDIVNAFNVFQYISFRSAYAAVTSLLIAFFLGPWVIQKISMLNIGQEIRSDGPQTHLPKAGTPTMGGVLIIVTFVISVLLWQELAWFYTWVILFSVISFGLLGFIDDYLKTKKANSDGLKARCKLFWQIGISTAIMLLIYLTGNEQTTLLYIPFFKTAILDLGVFYIPFGVLLIVGFSNAVNLTDGLDGLATGLVVIALIAFTGFAYLSGHVEFASYLIIPYLPGSGELTITATSLLGACVGFLWFNAHPAEIMMGDTGSLSLGGVLAVMSILLKKEFLLLIVGGVFMMEVLSVIIQVCYYKRTGKRVFKMAPLHHHFELSGWKESKVVTRFWILGGMFAILGLSTLKIQ